jgi:hypothetical protein
MNKDLEILQKTNLIKLTKLCQKKKKEEEEILPGVEDATGLRTE